jgi:hypothetical protein
MTVRRKFNRIDLPTELAKQREAQGGSTTKFLPAVRLETAAGLTLGVFPPGGNGLQPQELTVYLPPELPRAAAYDLKLVENSGENPAATSEEIEVGDLEFSEPWAGARWQVFTNREGRPFGSSSRVYRYVGTVAPELGEPSAYRPFACAPMPALRK